MTCFAPITGYYAKHQNENGKRNLVFATTQSNSGVPLKIPCGQCIGCKLERSRQWGMRCVHEAQLYDENIFVTLTYDDEHLPQNNGLVPRDLTLFMKKLRKQKGAGVRFFACGEYGEQTRRPHYHALLFNCGFRDKKYYKAAKRGEPLYTSATLQKIWDKGLATIGEVNFDTAVYVARYATKQLTGVLIMSDILPEFGRMSRRPGIGTEWFNKYQKQTYDHDSIVINHVETKPPKFYDKKLEALDSDQLNRIKKKRTRGIHRHLKNNTPERLAVREKVARAKLQLKGSKL